MITDLIIITGLGIIGISAAIGIYLIDLETLKRGL